MTQRSRLWSLAALLAVGLLAATLRLWQLDSLPPGFHLDESYQGLEAWRILTEPNYHPFFLRGNFGPLPLNAYLNVATFWLVEQFGSPLGIGAGPVAMRTTSAVVGVSTVLSMYGLAREMQRLDAVHAMRTSVRRAKSAHPNKKSTAPSLPATSVICHSRAGGNPSNRYRPFSAFAHLSWVYRPWIPAFAGMTLSAASVETVNSQSNRIPLPASGEKFWGWGFPLFAATALALMRWHVHFSRMAIEPIYVPLVWTLSTWWLLRGWRTGSWLAFVGSGVALGLGMYTYRGAWIIPLLLAVTVLHLLTLSTRKGGPSLRQISQRLRGPLLAALVATVVVAPLAWFFVNNPDLFTTRLQQVNIVGETASPADSTLLGNIAKTARMFGPFGQPGDPDPRRNLPGAPALSWPLALLFYFGLARCVWHLRPKQIFSKFSVTFSVPLLGLAGLLLPGVASEYAPHFHRVLGAAAPTALLVGLGAEWLAVGGWQLVVGRWRAVAGRGLAIGLLLTGGLLETRSYFSRWAELPALYYAFDEGLWQIGRALAEQPPDAPMYLSPREMTHPTLEFAWRTQRGTPIDSPDAPVSFDGRHVFPLNALPPDETELYAVIEHEDFRTSLLLPGALPDLVVVREFLDEAGDVYARFYERPPGSEFAWTPQHEMNVTLGDGIILAGYDVQPETLRTGEILYLQLRWLVNESPQQDWTVFTHLRTLPENEEGERVAGQDARPGNGSLPTTRWRSGWGILDEYQILLPADLPPGEYALWAGLYQPGGEQLPSGGGGVRLGYVEILGSE